LLGINKEKPFKINN